MCCLSDFVGPSSSFVFELEACTFKLEHLNSYLHFSKNLRPVVHFSSSDWFFADEPDNSKAQDKVERFHRVLRTKIYCDMLHPKKLE